MYSPEFEILDERFEKLAYGNVHLEKLYTGCRWVDLQNTPPALPVISYRPRF